jgi:hypothetical protein
LLALAVAALVLALSAGCSDDSSAAAHVGGTTIDNEEFLDEVGQWVGNPVAVDPASLTSTAPGSYPLELVRQLLQQRIDFEMARQEFEDRGLKLTDELRQQAVTLVLGDPANAKQAFAAFSDGFADDFVDDVARQVALQSELGEDGYSKWRTEAYKSTDIDVNPRYGTWDPETTQITAPEGPAEPGGESTTVQSVPGS